MAAEDAGRSELTQLVAYHVLRHIHGDELVAVVDCYGLSYEIRRNHGSSRPGLDGDLLVRLLRLDYSFFQFVENIRTFL